MAGAAMKFEVYCDETLPDLFTSAHPCGRYLMIGSLWLPAELRPALKARITQLRDLHNVHGGEPIAVCGICGNAGGWAGVR